MRGVVTIGLDIKVTLSAKSSLILAENKLVFAERVTLVFFW